MSLKGIIPFTICVIAIFALQACTAGSLRKEFKEEFPRLEAVCEQTCKSYGMYYTQVYTDDLEEYVCICRTESPYRQVRYRIR